jgi:hypothetical protein
MKKTKKSVQVNSKTSPKDNRATAYHGVAEPKKFGSHDDEKKLKKSPAKKSMRKW